MMKRVVLRAAAPILTLTAAAWAQTDVRSQNPLSGSVITGTATAEELPLSLEDAIRRGLKNNLAGLLDSQNRRSVEGARLRVLAALLPNLSARVSESSEQVNLAAFGFRGLPGVPQIVGPFAIGDARATLSQAILNFESINSSRAASQNVRAAQFAYQDTRDLVTLAVGDMYLDAVATESRVTLARAQLETDRALYQQAVDYKTSGLVPAIDVLRAQVEMESQQQRVIFYENDFEKKKLSVARAIGLPLDQKIRLTDKLPNSPAPPVDLPTLLDRALKGRGDYQSATASVKAAEATRKAALAERYPSLDFDGNYGTIGPSFSSNSHGTYLAEVGLNIPIFPGGRIRGDVLDADAQLQKRKAELADLRGRIEFDLKTALLDIQASAKQVEVTADARNLAAEQLGQARDRFKAGVADNLEVVQAQQAVAMADENYVSSLYTFSLAKGALVRSIGGAENLFRDFVLGQSPVLAPPAGAARRNQQP
ncbi:MAG TPA: TolC family protein [Bryobacteraceae bacterium]|nr:TolC family protein [Bryobacteraceae bacterium]